MSSAVSWLVQTERSQMKVQARILGQFPSAHLPEHIGCRCLSREDEHLTRPRSSTIGVGERQCQLGGLMYLVEQNRLWAALLRKRSFGDGRRVIAEVDSFPTIV